MEELAIWSAVGQTQWARSASFEALATEWRLWGYRLALKITGCPEAAEDAIQDALVRAYRSAHQLHDLQAASAWFRRIVVRCAMDQHPGPVSAFSEAAQQPSLLLEDALQVRRTMGRLRPDQRAILALAVGEGLSYEEIGRALGVPTGTVGSRLHAAKEAFRLAWGSER